MSAEYEAIAQSVTYLPCKHEDLRVESPEPTFKRPDTGGWGYI